MTPTKAELRSRLETASAAPALRVPPDHSPLRALRRLLVSKLNSSHEWQLEIWIASSLKYLLLPK